MGDKTKGDIPEEKDSEFAGPSKEPEIKEDLDSLLDSAIDDFDKPLPKVIQEPIQLSASASTKNPEQFPCNSSSKEWTENDFRQVQDAMRSILEEEPNMLQEHFSQLASGASSSNLGASLDEAMKLLANSGDSGLPGASSEEFEQFVNSFGKVGLGGGDYNGSQMPGFMPFFQNFMENLLSKEVLYPALKDIVAKYPGWLEENKQKLHQKEYENYSKQFELMTQICKEFEIEHAASDEGQKKSFEKILFLMQQMQEYGNPPEAIMGDFSSTLPFEELGNLKDGNVPDQCSIM